MCTVLRQLAQIKKAKDRWHRSGRVVAVTSLLADATPPDTKESEVDFAALQQNYPPRPEYGYDLTSLFRRAAERGARLLHKVNAGDRKLTVLDLGAGDGMLCALMAAAGHEAAICDFQDWRTEAAKKLRFIEADCSVEIPIEDDTFDVVCSFNSFEHFDDPARAFDECLRITKPGGFLHFSFDPLYSSPWGLHAYRTFRMPYPQFLFSEEFIETKLSELGIWDLGEKRSELQKLNRWKATQFAALWQDSSCHVIDDRRHVDESHTGLVQSYPQAFRGRGLTFEDLTCTGISVTLRNEKSPTEMHAGATGTARAALSKSVVLSDAT